MEITDLHVIVQNFLKKHFISLLLSDLLYSCHGNTSHYREEDKDTTQDSNIFCHCCWSIVPSKIQHFLCTRSLQLCNEYTLEGILYRTDPLQ
mmetsp:Transcript_4828/g.7055  ORF Transcript_4828/g.7055 Transcript_4828/m.7055 type:complete len:92 (+) Transcript_4828:156-431(+)